MITLNANLVHLRDTTILNQIARTGAAIGSILSKESRDLVDRSKSLLEYYEKYTRQLSARIESKFEFDVWTRPRLVISLRRCFRPIFHPNGGPKIEKLGETRSKGNGGQWKSVGEAYRLPAELFLITDAAFCERYNHGKAMGTAV